MQEQNIKEKEIPLPHVCESLSPVKNIFNENCTKLVTDMWKKNSNLSVTEIALFKQAYENNKKKILEKIQSHLNCIDTLQRELYICKCLKKSVVKKFPS